jgi:hypothetical protein
LHQPPASTGIYCPVIVVLSSLARNNARLATSWVDEMSLATVSERQMPTWLDIDVNLARPLTSDHPDVILRSCIDIDIKRDSAFDVV